MVPLPWLAVVFAGILGGKPDADRIGKEVAAAIRERAELTAVSLPAKDLRALTHHSSGSREIVAKLEVDGLIAGELIASDGTVTLRLVVYTGEGGMRSLTEIPLRNGTLGLDDLSIIRTNLSDEAVALGKAARRPAKPAPAAEPKAVAKVTPKPVPVEPPPTPKPAPKAEVASAPAGRQRA